MFAKTIHIDTNNSILRKDLLNFIDENNKIIVNSEDIDVILNIISDFIINNVDEVKLKKFISKRCGIQNLEDIKEYANEKIYDHFNRKLRLKSLLIDYLTKNNSINVEGFIRFRLKDYYNLLEKIIGEITDDYMITKEYDNFIILIKKLIQTQNSLINNLTVIVTYDDKYNLYDDYMINITNLCISEFLEEFNYEKLNVDDFLFSSILSIAPKSITIHNYEQINNQDLLNTISKIYEANLVLCNGCEMCKKNSD